MPPEPAARLLAERLLPLALVVTVRRDAAERLRLALERAVVLLAGAAGSTSGVTTLAGVAG